jgi:alkylation response protein AidB-like acyl-CoA dehydrogenase
VDLGVSDEQAALVASFGNLLAKSSSPERVRAAEPGGFDAELWRALVEVGAVTMAVAEDHGGWGASLLDLSLVAEQLGRALAPAPVIEAQTGARLLARIGSTLARDELRRVIEGPHMVTVALHPPRAGTAVLVPSGAVCDGAVVLDGERLLLLDVREEGRRPVANLAAAPLADLAMAGSAELMAGPPAVACFEAALDEWLVLTAAALVGLASVALEITCDYARERRAFGAPIGAFQGVAHALADDATNLDGARLLAQKAAWALATGDRRGRELAAMAFAFASGAAASATYDALHFHGGYGFMLEQDVQLHYRRARGWARVWGDPEAGFQRAARARYGSAGRR